MSAQVEVEPGVRAELASGRARVVVELTLPDGFHSEGTLGEDAVRAQRQAIRVAQQSILAALEGTDARLLRDHHTIPFLTLEIGPKALAKLETLTNEITRILEDSSAVAN